MAAGNLLYDKCDRLYIELLWLEEEREREGERRENGRMERRDVESNDLILTDYRYLFWNQK